jgi:two-component system nitrogen regulation response regulator GlnG
VALGQPGDGDLVITDVVMPDENAFDLLPRIKKLRPELPVIVMSAQNTFMTAIRASERGAYEYLPKPFDLKELITIVGRALSEPKERPRAPVRRRTSTRSAGRALAGDAGNLPGAGALMQTDLVMISGESGPARNWSHARCTTTAAQGRAVCRHQHGQSRGPIQSGCSDTRRAPYRRQQPQLRPLRAGRGRHAVPRRDRRHADGGADTALRVAAGRIHDGRRPHDQDRVRIIAATNKDLRILIQQGLFREDLFFRLNVVPLRLPAARPDRDVPDLIRHFFAQAEREGLPPKQLDPAALERIKRYRWPGNVRELENLARRLAALYPQEIISAAVVDAELSQPATAPASDEPRAQDEGLGAAIERHLATYFASFGDDLPPPGLYHRVLREVEHPLLSVTLAATRGNQIRAADLLGVNRNTLRKKIRDLDIQVFRTSN